jgi:hypothetical protein
MNKYTGQSKKKQESRAQKKVNTATGMIDILSSKIHTFSKDLADKYNNLRAASDEGFKRAAFEFGKLWGNQQSIAESVDHIDLNVLVVSRLFNDLYRRFSRIDAALKKLEELAGETLVSEQQALDAEAAGDALRTEETKKAFAEAHAARAEELARREEAAAAEKKNAKAAAEAKTEAERAEKALREAETELVTDAASGGGKGSDIPEGAQVFGG